ncbi:MAG: hypothetical protein R6X32_06105 [Chloroflexota bacterium]
MADQQELYGINSWHGQRVYQCSLCPFDTRRHFSVLAEHMYRRHGKLIYAASNEISTTVEANTEDLSDE